MMQQGSGTLGVPSLYACRKVFFCSFFAKKEPKKL